MALLRSPRSLILSVLGLLLGSLALLAWSWLRTGPRAERLIHQARALEETPFRRPSHGVPPTLGTFAEALTPLLPELTQLHTSLPQLDPETHGQCEKFARGSLGLEALPEPCRQSMERVRGLLHRVLAATRAEEGGLPAHLRHMNGSLPSRRDSHKDLNAVWWLSHQGPREVRWLLAQEQQAQAVEVCLDTLALGRELASSNGPDLRPSSTYKELYPPCAQALAAAPLERQRQAAEQLLRLRQGLPSLADALRNDFITRQLLISGGLLTQEQRARLPPVARGLADLSASEYQKAGAYAPLLGRPAWALLERAFGEAIAAAERPPPEREEALAALAERTQSSWLPEVMPSWYLELEEEYELQRLWVDGLLGLVQAHVARAERGRWPDPLPPPASERLRLVVQPDGSAQLQPLQPSQAREALTLGAPAPR